MNWSVGHGYCNPLYNNNTKYSFLCCNKYSFYIEYCGSQQTIVIKHELELLDEDDISSNVQTTNTRSL